MLRFGPSGVASQHFMGRTGVRPWTVRILGLRHPPFRRSSGDHRPEELPGRTEEAGLRLAHIVLPPWRAIPSPCSASLTPCIEGFSITHCVN
jgi:hypothetical protein